ncbi:hypothetical protein RP20_CCG015454 [Aedes albopictus]|nr:hypothetical protein RP20_CCG015454 [Aedes albopictus]
MVDDTTDDEVRIKVFLEVAKHHFKACRYSEMNRWIHKAQELITETTPPEIVIGFQQLKALHLFHSKMILDAYSTFKQAIDRTREIFGHHHRRYAETLYTFGATLVKNRYCYGFQMLLYGIQMLIEVLIIFTTLYGERTPHANDIYRYLALGFNRLVKSLGRMYRSCNRLLNTVLVAQLVMNHLGVSSHFVAVATLIIQSTPCELMLAIGNSDFSSAEEIKEICSKMSKKLDVSEPTTK